MKRTWDYSIYAVVDGAALGSRRAAAVVRAAAAGGATVLELTMPAAEPAALSMIARACDVVRPLGIPLVVRGSEKWTLAGQADGLRLETAAACRGARRRGAGEDLALGVTVSDPAEARAAERAGATYVCASPALVRAIGRAVRLPVVAEGGVLEDEAAAAIRAGAAGVRVRCDAWPPARLASVLRHWRRTMFEARGLERLLAGKETT
jgi:thiamine-phosphate pyrophosphorylase